MRLRQTSLRSKVLAATGLALLFATLIVIAIEAIVLGPALEANQQNLLGNEYQTALKLDGHSDLSTIAERISSAGYSVAINPLENNAPKTSSFSRNGESVSIEGILPISKSAITITTSSNTILATLQTTLWIGIVSISVASGLALVWLRHSISKSLAPLGQMSSLASEYSKGGRGKRLRLAETSDELGSVGVAMNSMLDEVEKSEQRIIQLCADVAHELRTPLATIAASAENILYSGDKSVELDRAMLVNIREANRAARIVETLTQVAQIDSHLDNRVLSGLSLAKARALVAPMLDSIGETSDVHVETLWHGDVQECLIKTDSGKVQQILANLLGNATHWAVSEIRIEVSLNERGLALSVWNDGPPIPKDKLEEIFERFVRLDPSRSRATGGSGLGLSISRGLALQLGGQLYAVEVDRGAKFVLELPLEQATKEIGVSLS